MAGDPHGDGRKTSGGRHGMGAVEERPKTSKLTYPRAIWVDSGRVVAGANPSRGILKIRERSRDDRSLLTNREERFAEEERKWPVLSGDQGENVKWS